MIYIIQENAAVLLGARFPVRGSDTDTLRGCAPSGTLRQVSGHSRPHTDAGAGGTRAQVTSTLVGPKTLHLPVEKVDNSLDAAGQQIRLTEHHGTANLSFTASAKDELLYYRLLVCSSHQASLLFSSNVSVIFGYVCWTRLTRMKESY